jgi:chemotaxis protein MotB
LSINPRRIAVEGYTDNTVPLEESFVISARRAEIVLQYLLRNEALPPQLFSVVGYGSFKPVVENSSDLNRARNRRVRILVEPLGVVNEDFYF